MGTTELLFESLGRFFVADIAHLRYTPSSALARAARAARLGPPITNEHQMVVEGSSVAFQFFMGGLVWNIEGKAGEIHVARW